MDVFNMQDVSPSKNYFVKLFISNQHNNNNNNNRRAETKKMKKISLLKFKLAGVCRHSSVDLSAPYTAGTGSSPKHTIHAAIISNLCYICLFIVKRMKVNKKRPGLVSCSFHCKESILQTVEFVQLSGAHSIKKLHGSVNYGFTVKAKSG